MALIYVEGLGGNSNGPMFDVKSVRFYRAKPFAGFGIKSPYPV